MAEVGGDYEVCGVVAVVGGSHMAVVYGGSRFVGQMGCFVGCIGG